LQSATTTRPAAARGGQPERHYISSRSSRARGRDAASRPAVSRDQRAGSSRIRRTLLDVTATSGMRNRRPRPRRAAEVGGRSGDRVQWCIRLTAQEREGRDAGTTVSVGMPHRAWLSRRITAVVDGTRAGRERRPPRAARSRKQQWPLRFRSDFLLAFFIWSRAPRSAAAPHRVQYEPRLV